MAYVFIVKKEGASWKATSTKPKDLKAEGADLKAVHAALRKVGLLAFTVAESPAPRLS